MLLKFHKALGKSRVGKNGWVITLSQFTKVRDPRPTPDHHEITLLTGGFLQKLMPVASDLFCK